MFVSADSVPRVNIFLTIFLILDWRNHSYLFLTLFIGAGVFLLVFILHFSLFLRPRLLHRIAIPLGVFRGLRGNHPTPSTEGVNAFRVFVGHAFGV